MHSGSQRFAAALAAALLFACAGSNGGGRGGSGESIVEVDGAITLGSDDLMRAWLAYGLARRLWIDARFFEEHPGESTYRYTFDEEVYARNMVAELSKQDGVSDPYLRQLAAVGRAGYVREYVWACLAQADWTKPDDLRVGEFRAWRDATLPDHRVETRVSVRTEGENIVVSVGREAHPARPCANAAGARLHHAF